MVQFARPQDDSNIISPIVPRDFVTKPFFPAKSSDQPRYLTIDGRQWVIGSPRLDGRARKPDFDIRHGRVCFALLSFRDRIKNENYLSFSINELAHTYARSNGGRYCRNLLELLYDLNDTVVWIDHGTPEFQEFKILEALRVNGKPARRRDARLALSRQGELWLDFVHLNPTFFGLVKGYQNLARIRLDVLNSMTSMAAQAIYAFLPSRGVHRGEDNPFEIRLDTLMQQIGMDVPKHKSKRLDRFTQNKSSIIDQLNGAATTSGTLHVHLTETNDRSDYKLCAWVDTPTVDTAPPVTGQSAMLDAWLASGRPRSEFTQRIKAGNRLAPHLIDLIKRAGAEYATNDRFYFMIAALLGHRRFEIILSETKSDALEGNPGKNPTGRLIWRLMKALKERS